MVIRVRAYTPTPSGGPANAAWRYWLDNVSGPSKTYLRADNPLDVVAANREKVIEHMKWLQDEYGAYIDYHREGNETDRYAELVFGDEHMAALFLLRFP
jgi:hypothetical protein